MSGDPAITIGTQDEARALRIAVRYALQAGLATDGWDANGDRTGPLTNESLVSVARKIGLDVESLGGGS